MSLRERACERTRNTRANILGGRLGLRAASRGTLKSGGSNRFCLSP